MVVVVVAAAEAVAAAVAVAVVVVVVAAVVVVVVVVVAVVVATLFCAWAAWDAVRTRRRALAAGRRCACTGASWSGGAFQYVSSALS